jgi:hypothetical protein
MLCELFGMKRKRSAFQDQALGVKDQAKFAHTSAQPALDVCFKPVDFFLLTEPDFCCDDSGIHDATPESTEQLD